MQDSPNASPLPAAAYIGIGQIKPLGSAIEVPVAGGGCGSEGGAGKAAAQRSRHLRRRPAGGRCSGMALMRSPVARFWYRWYSPAA